jgi:hypothetical protein
MTPSGSAGFVASVISSATERAEPTHNRHLANCKMLSRDPLYFRARKSIRTLVLRKSHNNLTPGFCQNPQQAIESVDGLRLNAEL